MEAPREWFVTRSLSFDGDRDALENLGRIDEIILAWIWMLERNPLRVAHGLTAPGDDIRVIRDTDESTGIRYVAGVHVEFDTHGVELAWLSALPPADETPE